jgi:hypothetical protein
LIFDGKKINLKNRMVKYMPSILVFLIFTSSCRKVQDLPPEPRIEFRSFDIFDTLDILGNLSKGGRLKFYFEDGDGDLGLKEPTLPRADSTNLFLILYKKRKGNFEPADANDLLYPSDYRIPYMVRLGQNKILKGTISVTFLYLFYNPSDTIKYDFYIKDRALHESNIATTCEIVIRNNGICNSE